MEGIDNGPTLTSKISKVAPRAYENSRGSVRVGYELANLKYLIINFHRCHSKVAALDNNIMNIHLRIEFCAWPFHMPPKTWHDNITFIFLSCVDIGNWAQAQCGHFEWFSFSVGPILCPPIVYSTQGFKLFFIRVGLVHTVLHCGCS